MATLGQLRKEANAAPKFVLMSFDTKTKDFVYVKENQTSIFGCDVTTNIDEATKFSIGYDNPKMKVWGWNNAAKSNNLKLQFFDIAEKDIIKN